MARKIKWAVLGWARIARKEVIPAICRTANSQFYALASRHEEHLDECRAEFGCVKVYRGYLDILKDPEVDAVYIPLPNSMHKEWAIAAARHGKHVLCEKPMALTPEDAEAMIAAAQENQVLLMEAFMYRYTERIARVREILDQGVIGPVKFIHSSFRFDLDRANTIKVQPELGGGALYDVGCYPVNFANMVTANEPVAVAAEAHADHGVDISFSGVLKYPEGAIATVSCGFNSFRRVFSEIVGTQGTLEVPDTFMGNAGSIRLITAAGAQEIPVAESDRYGLEIADFAQAILDGKRPRLDLAETVINLRTIARLLKQIA